MLLGQCGRDLLRHADPATVAVWVFRSLVDLQAAINRYLGEHNPNANSFVRTADPNRITEKVFRGYQAMASYH